MPCTDEKPDPNRAGEGLGSHLVSFGSANVRLENGVMGAGRCRSTVVLGGWGARLLTSVQYHWDWT